MELYRVAQAARWPRPFALFVIAAILALGSAVWRPLLVAVALIWAALAGLAVLDARSRGRRGIVTGVATALGGPLAAAVIARTTRGAVRKVGSRFRSALPYAVVFAIAGGAVGFAIGNAVLDRVAFTAPAPSGALAPRIQERDRLVISHALLGRLTRTELVAIGPFPAASRVLGSDRVIAIGRILGMPGEWIGATEEGALYTCTAPPDITKPITGDDGCAFPDETTYLTARTEPFGPVEVPPGSVFVLADDRTVLDDSRTFGPVPESALAGRIIATAWPPGRIAVR